jgi:hypothetical protein
MGMFVHQILCSIISKPNPSGEMAAEAAPIPDPHTVWVR